MLYRSSSLYQPESDEDEDTQENIGDEKEEELDDTDAERTYSVEEDVKEDREEEQQYTSDSASEIEEEEEEQEDWSTWHFPPHNDANLPFVILCTFQNLLMWFSVH